jgi:hypothetical protein
MSPDEAVPLAFSLPMNIDFVVARKGLFQHLNMKSDPDLSPQRNRLGMGRLKSIIICQW